MSRCRILVLGLKMRTRPGLNQDGGYRGGAEELRISFIRVERGFCVGMAGSWAGRTSLTQMPSSLDFAFQGRGA